MSITVRIRKKLSDSFELEVDFTTSSPNNVGIGQSPHDAGNTEPQTAACLGILGASGSGKSMTLKCIAGIETPDEGFIAIDGRVLFDSAAKIKLKPQERQVGYLFQNYALFPKMTVLENITVAFVGGSRPPRSKASLFRYPPLMYQRGERTLQGKQSVLLSSLSRKIRSDLQPDPAGALRAQAGLALRVLRSKTLDDQATTGALRGQRPRRGGSPQRSAGEGGAPPHLIRARALIERFGLQGLENRYPRELSGGEQQRVALARMLIRDPCAILLDEPFSALDTSLREQMQLQLQNLLAGDRLLQTDRLLQVESAANAIMVTHSRDEAYRLCPDLAVMEHGKIVAFGKTQALFADPGTVVTAKITGCKNISPVRVLGSHEVFALDWGIRLRTAKPATGATHIGIRAHELQPVHGEAPPTPIVSNPPPPPSNAVSECNTMSVNIVQDSSDPFENSVIFVNAQAQNASEQKPIWWKYSKYSPQQIPRSLRCPPEALLLLK
jgi:ABC-type sulfate/molybdate transport systems ATPase subunit